mmetsp:Transcript_33797/g.84752  ORF Transcript_33797/g.84752 Transcript_33797/m.84752 type:complete len:349 (-) Transcript_33797:44-1090(-)
MTAMVAEDPTAGARGAQGGQPRRRWGPLNAMRGIRKGLTTVVRAPARRLRRRQQMATMSSQLIEPARLGGLPALQQQMEWLSTTVAGSLGRLLPQQYQQQEAGANSEEQRLSRREYSFPEQLCFGGSCQELTATGHRTWGSWKDGRGLLNIKIYDFALYVDKEQARKSQLSRRYRHVGEFSALRDDRAFYSDLRSSPDIHMSLLVRTNHVLPIGVMAREYERILRKRITLVGGDRQDPHLNTMLDCFKEANLPDHVKWGPGSVRKGTLLTFRRTPGGGLAACANHEELGAVPSQQVAAALFDLYLGDNPVHHRAKRDAAQAVHEAISAGPPAPQPCGPIIPLPKLLTA